MTQVMSVSCEKVFFFFLISIPHCKQRLGPHYVGHRKQLDSVGKLLLMLIKHPLVPALITGSIGRW